MTQRNYTVSKSYKEKKKERIFKLYIEKLFHHFDIDVRNILN